MLARLVALIIYPNTCPLLDIMPTACPMENGAWSMEHVAWRMEHGACGTGNGSWGMSHGAYHCGAHCLDYFCRNFIFINTSLANDSVSEVENEY
jgi:hypothetical protein